jgi:hypothetical protein
MNGWDWDVCCVDLSGYQIIMDGLKEALVVVVVWNRESLEVESLAGV